MFLRHPIEAFILFFFKNITQYVTLPILRLEWMLGLANRVPGPLRACRFARPWSLLFLREMQSRKSLADSLEIVCWQIIFSPWWAKDITVLCWKVKMTVDIPKGTTFNEKLLFPIRGFVHTSVIGCYTFRSIPFRAAFIFFVVHGVLEDSQMI